MSWRWIVIVIVLFQYGCTSTPKQVQSACKASRTLLDGVCVRLEVADFVSCVRSQSVELSEEDNKKLSAEVGYLGVKVSGASELSNKLNKKYSTSDKVMMVIINRCDRLVSNTPLSENIAPKSDNSICNKGLDVSIDCKL